MVLDWNICKVWKRRIIDVFWQALIFEIRQTKEFWDWTFRRISKQLFSCAHTFYKILSYDSRTRFKISYLSGYKLYILHFLAQFAPYSISALSKSDCYYQYYAWGEFFLFFWINSYDLIRRLQSSLLNSNSDPGFLNIRF